MSLISTDHLNTFWREGVLPLKDNQTLHTTAITELQSAVITEQDNIDDIEDRLDNIENNATASTQDIETIKNTIWT